MLRPHEELRAIRLRLGWLQREMALRLRISHGNVCLLETYKAQRRHVLAARALERNPDIHVAVPTEALAAARRRLRMTQAEMARQLGVTTKTMSNIENGKSDKAYLYALAADQLAYELPTIRARTRDELLAQMHEPGQPAWWGEAQRMRVDGFKLDEIAARLGHNVSGIGYATRLEQRIRQRARHQLNRRLASLPTRVSVASSQPSP